MGTGMTEIFLRWMFGIKSPSREFAKAGKEFIVKPFNEGWKKAEKLHRKYMAHRKRFERKWLKQNASWADTRQKKKALEKAFLKEFPQYGVQYALERAKRIWMI